MSASKHFDKICCIVLCFTLVITLLFMNAESFGVEAAGNTMGYENRLFDTSRVHTIDIVMDDWEGFLDTCTNEEYSVCSVIIDGEAYKNVGIRAKGNTSLSSVASYGNDRYSFKIEFDQYDDTKSYYGLDKLSLNNIIQDTTYMKDYLVYQMMGQFGVAAPLCSYAYITVNGEDFGLYLAVEAVEDGFLTRNYGSNYGDLYKPDSMSMSGGRGNGKDFDREDMENMFEGFGDRNPFGGGSDNNSTGSSDTETDTDSSATPDMGGPQMPDMSQFGGGMNFPGTDGTEMPDMSQFGGGMNFPGMGDMQMPEGSESPDGETSEGDTGKSSSDKKGGFDFGGFGGFGGNDVSLVYSDDDYDSYSNIFGNAKTTVTDADKERLIASLKQMNEGTNIEEVVNVEEVIRYFVVHNFAVNFDSYTGSMIHNYYLYEKDGKMEMIPWDYNLAFGTFQGSSDATSLINYPIDTPVSGGNVESRPMLAWIFASEEYTELYHEFFAEFMVMFYEDGTLPKIIDTVSEMIAPYIEKQPRSFYTYEEFQTGVATLKEFCSLRLESIEGQLNGTIPATSSGQSADSSALVDSSGIKVSDMGSFGGGGGGFGGGSRGDKSGSGNRTERPSGNTSDIPSDSTGTNVSSKRPSTENVSEGSTEEPTGDTVVSSDVFEINATIASTAPGNKQTNDTQKPDMSQFGGGIGSFPNTGEMPNMSQFGGNMGNFPNMGEMPDMSQFGGDMSNFPNIGDMELPEDFQSGNMPWGDMFGGNSSSGDTEGNDASSSSKNETQSGNGSGSNRIERPNAGSSGFDWGSMSGNYSSGNNRLTNWVLLGISVLVLAGGLVFAILYGRKRY